MVTATDETLEIRTGAAMAGPTPRCRPCRRPVLVDARRQRCGRIRDRGRLARRAAHGRHDEQLDAINAETSDRPVTAELIEELQRRNDLGLAATVRTPHLGASTVAAYDRGEIVLGVAGGSCPQYTPATNDGHGCDEAYV